MRWYIDLRRCSRIYSYALGATPIDDAREGVAPQSYVLQWMDIRNTVHMHYFLLVMLKRHESMVVIENETRRLVPYVLVQSL